MVSRVRLGQVATLLLCLLVVLASVPISAVQAAGPIRLTVDGADIKTDVPPVIVNGRTMMPLRATMEAIGADLTWDQATRTATVKLGNQVVVLTAGKGTATVNGKSVNLDVPAQIIDNRMMAPVRFIVESTGGEVDWLPDQNWVVLGVKDEAVKSKLREDKAQRTIPDEPVTYTADATKFGFRLTSPAKGHIAADGVVHLRAVAGPDLEGKLIVMKIPQLSKFTETVLQVRNGKLEHDFYIPGNPGAYMLSLFVLGADGNSLTRLTDLKVRNVSPVWRQGPFYTKYFYDQDIQLDLPTGGKISADTTVKIGGTVKGAPNGCAIWFYTKWALHDWSTYAIVKDGKFSGEAHMGDGPSRAYWVQIQLQGPNCTGSEWNTIAMVPVVNTNPNEIDQKLVMYVAGLRRGITIDPFPGETKDGFVRISGSVAPNETAKSVWVQVQWTTSQFADYQFDIVNGRFGGDVALSFGRGQHSILFGMPGSTTVLGVAYVKNLSP